MYSVIETLCNYVDYTPRRNTVEDWQYIFGAWQSAIRLANTGQFRPLVAGSQ
jgi:hypothetical protein